MCVSAAINDHLEKKALILYHLLQSESVLSDVTRLKSVCLSPLLAVYPNHFRNYLLLDLQAGTVLSDQQSTKYLLCKINFLCKLLCEHWGDVKIHRTYEAL